MGRVRSIWPAVLLAAPLAVAGGGQGDPALLARSAVLADPRHAGAPFELVAHGTAPGLGEGHAARCAYHLVWVGPGRWREEAAAGEVQEERGEADGVGWRAGRPGPSSPLLQRLRDLLDVGQRLTPRPGEAVREVTRLRAFGRDVDRVILGDAAGRSRRLDLDGPSGVLLREARGEEEVELSGWVRGAIGLFPRTLRLRRGGKIELEIQVDELEPVSPAAVARAFTSP